MMLTALVGCFGTPKPQAPQNTTSTPYCKDKSTLSNPNPINRCQEMRDWFEDVFSEKNGVYDGKFLNSAENGVLLLSNIRTKSELRAFCTKYPNALTHAGSKGVHSPEIYSYLHAKMLKFCENYDPKSNFNMPITDVAQKAKFKNDIEVFLKDVGRSFLEDDKSINDPPSVNQEIRDIVTRKTDLFSFFCQSKSSTPTP